MKLYILTALLFIPISVLGGDLEDGRAAIYSGEYVKAKTLLMPLAEAGNPVAQNAMGVLYLKGWGVEQDYAVALKWYQSAADNGDAKGQYNLGRMYDNGWGVQKDDKQAVKWFRMAAEQGYPQAQSILGAMYATGDGVKKDYGKAMKWYRRAAEQGDPEAQRRVGFMYVMGQGVPKNFAKAVPWFQKGAEQGHAGSFYWLGRLYYEGKGVEQNREKGESLLKQAAAQGGKEAEQYLQNEFKRVGENGRGGQPIAQGDNAKTRGKLESASTQNASSELIKATGSKIYQRVGQAYSSYESDLLSIRHPISAENGDVVPLKITVNSSDIGTLWVFVEGSDTPLVASAEYHQVMKSYFLSWRLKMERTGSVLFVYVTNTGQLLAKRASISIGKHRKIEIGSAKKESFGSIRLCQRYLKKGLFKKQPEILILVESPMTKLAFINSISVYTDNSALATLYLTPGISKNSLFGLRYDGTLSDVSVTIEGNDGSERSVACSVSQSRQCGKFELGCTG